MPFTTAFTLVPSPASLLFGAPKKNGRAGFTARTRLIRDSVAPGLERSLSMFQEAHRAFKKMRSRCAAAPVSLPPCYAEVGEAVDVVEYASGVCEVDLHDGGVISPSLDDVIPTIDMMTLLHQEVDSMLSEVQAAPSGVSAFDEGASFASVSVSKGEVFDLCCSASSPLPPNYLEKGELEYQMEMLLAEMWAGEDVDLDVDDELEMLRL